MSISFNPGTKTHLTNNNIPQNEENLKRQYEEALTNTSNICGSFWIRTNELTMPQWQALYLELKNVFTNQCQNEHRCRIIEALLKVPQDQWTVLMKQVCFLMPNGTKGHDVMWATETLTSIQDTSFREQLVHTANGLFTYNASTSERGYILEKLSNLSPDKISELYRAEKQQRKEFVDNCLPTPNFRKGHKTVLLFDRIQNKTYNVEEKEDGSLVIINEA